MLRSAVQASSLSDVDPRLDTTSSRIAWAAPTSFASLHDVKERQILTTRLAAPRVEFSVAEPKRECVIISFGRTR